MRVTTQRSDLLELLSKVRQGVPSRTTLPILTSVMVVAKNGQLTLTANNLDLMLSGDCKAAVSKAGAICTMPKELENFLKAMKAEDVTLEGKGTRFTVKSNGSTMTINGYEAKDFPVLGEEKDGKAITLTGLAKALDLVDYAMAKNQNRPVLNGICLSPEGKGIQLVAIDGFQLGMTTLKAKGLPRQVIIPEPAIRVLKRLFPDASLIVGEKYLHFQQGDLCMVLSPIEGTFPDYKAVIPSDKSPMLKVATTELKEALAMVEAIKPKNEAVRLETKGKNLIVSAKNNEDAVINTKIPAKGKAKVIYNIKYLKALLARAGQDFAMRTATAGPGVVRNNGSTFVIMPMAIDK